MQNNGNLASAESGRIVPPENAFASLLPQVVKNKNSSLNLESYIKVSNMSPDLSKNPDVSHE